MAQITITNVWKIYNEGGKEHQVFAVKDLNLECRDGEFISLLGPSGCGKTSSLRMIAGLETVSRGEIFIGDRLVNNLHPSERDIAMVFESYALYQHLNIYENIAFPLRVRNMPEAEIDRRVKRAVDILKIDDLLDRVPAHLSDGQKQRVSIGRAIVREPAAFLMDEPISHLDAILRSRMRREIKHLQGELGITTVYVTHDQLEATAMADRIAVMNLGELQQVGTPREIFENPANIFVADFVGEPPMNFFDMEVQRDGDRLLLTMEGLSIDTSGTPIERALNQANLNSVKAGIRPMYAEAVDPHSEGAVMATVYFLERLDEFNIVTATIGHHHVLIETEPLVCPSINDTIWMRLPADKMIVFDPATGKNILY